MPNAAPTDTLPAKNRTVCISNKGLGLASNLKELWQYRDLVLVFALRDLQAPYRQSILGPAWFFINPLFSALVFTMVFGKLAGLSTDGTPQFLFYLTGTTCWTFFKTVFTNASNTFVTNKGMFGKVYFPRLVPPTVTLITNTARSLVQFGIITGCWLYYRYCLDADIQITSALLLIPLVWIVMALLAMGCGLVASAATAKYRDFRYIISFLMTAWMYSTPIIYPLSMVPKQYQWLASLNPLTPLIESVKLGILGRGTVNIDQAYIGVGISLILLWLGLKAFARVEKNFMDNI